MEDLNNNFIEKNLKKVRIEGDRIVFGEGQSCYQDIFSTYLLGPKKTNYDIDVFNTLEGSHYEISSEGYFSCAEISGTFDINKKFMIHALDAKNFKAHFDKIAKISEESNPEKIEISIDDARGNREEYLAAFKDLFGPETEIIIKDN